MIHATMIISILSLLATMGGETTRGRPTKRSSIRIRIRMNLKIHGSSCYGILYMGVYLQICPDDFLSFFSQKVIDHLSFPFSFFLSFLRNKLSRHSIAEHEAAALSSCGMSSSMQVGDRYAVKYILLTYLACGQIRGFAVRRINFPLPGNRGS